MLAPTGCTATYNGVQKQQLWLLQTQGTFLRLEVTSLERLTFFKLPGTEWPRARLFKGQPSPAVFGGLPRTQAYSQPLSAATAAGLAVSSTVSLQKEERERPDYRQGQREMGDWTGPIRLPLVYCTHGGGGGDGVSGRCWWLTG